MYQLVFGFLTCNTLVFLPATHSFTKYPDDPRFRIYRVFKKFSMESCLVEAAKEAIGGMLDSQVAVMQSEGVPETSGPKNKSGKGGGNKGKGGGKGGGKTNPDAEAAKQLQRNIKLFLEVQHYTICIP